MQPHGVVVIVADRDDTHAPDLRSTARPRLLSSRTHQVQFGDRREQGVAFAGLLRRSVRIGIGSIESAFRASFAHIDIVGLES